MKNKISKILLNKFIINSSDILELTSNDEFKNKLDNLNINEIINIKSKLIHKKDISLLEVIIFNIDNYISYLKNILEINQLQIRYIAYLTMYENNYLFDKLYYYDNIEYYNNIFKEIFYQKYKNNYEILSKFKNIPMYSYKELISKINKNKNRAYAYFENINQNNALYYLNIYEYNDSI